MQSEFHNQLEEGEFFSRTFLLKGPVIQLYRTIHFIRQVRLTYSQFQSNYLKENVLRSDVFFSFVQQYQIFYHVIDAILVNNISVSMKAYKR